MNPIFTIKPHSGLRTALVIHPQKAVEMGMADKRFMAVSFGQQRCYVDIKLEEAISSDEILLPRNLIRLLHLPEYLVYEMAIRGNELIMGPCIGLLLSREDKRLTVSRLDRALIFAKAYNRLHGAIILFALDKVDSKQRLVEGYCYNPASRYWQKGIFPYPSSIYRTIGLNPSWKNHFLSVIGDKVFNSRFFSKWEMYQWLCHEPEVAPHLPDTVLYVSPADALAMLERYPAIYIKPIHGLQGRGIFRIQKADKWLCQFRAGGVNRCLELDGPDQAAEFMKRRFHHGRYIVQQGIELLEYRGGLIDFRCVLQKNQANTWACQAVIGRCGIRKSIVSNISSGGTAYSAEAILRKALDGTEEEIAVLQDRIASFAIAVANKLDQYGINCGTLGFDIGLAPSGHLWLIEINNRDPDPGIALDIHDVPLFYTLMTGPLFYAKCLAGFKEE
jgi:hypothetical protein